MPAVIAGVRWGPALLSGCAQISPSLALTFLTLTLHTRTRDGAALLSDWLRPSLPHSHSHSPALAPTPQEMELGAGSVAMDAALQVRCGFRICILIISNTGNNQCILRQQAVWPGTCWRGVSPALFSFACCASLTNAVCRVSRHTAGCRRRRKPSCVRARQLPPAGQGRVTTARGAVGERNTPCPLVVHVSAGAEQGRSGARQHQRAVVGGCGDGGPGVVGRLCARRPAPDVRWAVAWLGLVTVLEVRLSC